MRFDTVIEALKYRYPDTDRAKKEFRALREMAKQAERHLIPHRELVERIKKYGLHAI